MNTKLKGSNKGLRCQLIDIFYIFFLNLLAKVIFNIKKLFLWKHLPIKSHEIAQWKLMALWTTNNAFLRIDFLSAAHRIHDDQHFLVVVSYVVPMQKVRKKAFVAIATETVA